ncbi:MAG TPA: right-handed parallel beta-helix repeat-containing protein [Thermoanaerobaculia bacterium]|nr:right-handed parallel beta-helix repeat-containing protein [Thermoanaerobaculia bacterium]
MRERLLVTILLTCAAASAGAAVLRVPADHASIQAAVDAALDGDEVVVAPGTYHEATNLLGKSITLRSEGGAAVTILDGSMLGTSIITATSGESLATVVRGFTFRNGTGRFVGACGIGGFLGGGIFVENGGISVADSLFENNEATDPATGERGPGGGAAIFACEADLAVSGSMFRNNGANFGGAIFYSADARNLTVTGSRFVANRGIHGGALLVQIDIDSRVTVTATHFEANEGLHGSGIRLHAGSRSTVAISGCSFRNGRSAFGGGANLTAGGRAEIEVSHCDFIGNEAGFGGGLFAAAFGNQPLSPTGGRISVTGSSFVANVSRQFPGGGGVIDGCFRDGPPPDGGLYGGGADLRTISGGSITVTSSLFARNSGESGGGVSAASCEGGETRLVNCTIVDNEPFGAHFRIDVPDGLPNSPAGSMHVVNSIVRGNRGAEQIVIDLRHPEAAATVTFSNVEGGMAGEGNIDLPVMFAGSTPCDYRLLPGSAGIDAGNNEALEEPGAGDLDGRPRFIDDPTVTDSGAGGAPVVDMGAYELQPPAPAGGRRRATRPERPCL